MGRRCKRRITSEIAVAHVDRRNRELDVEMDIPYNFKTATSRNREIPDISSRVEFFYNFNKERPEESEYRGISIRNLAIGGAHRIPHGHGGRAGGPRNCGNPGFPKRPAALRGIGKSRLIGFHITLK